jgi:hypothetical protein
VIQFLSLAGIARKGRRPPWRLSHLWRLPAVLLGRGGLEVGLLEPWMIIGGRLSGRKVFRSQLLWCCDCFVSAVVLLLFLGGGVKVPCRGRRGPFKPTGSHLRNSIRTNEPSIFDFRGGGSFGGWLMSSLRCIRKPMMDSTSEPIESRGVLRVSAQAPA